MAQPKKQRFINAEIPEGAEFKTIAFQSKLAFSGASAVSAHSAVKLRGIEISLENSTVSIHPFKPKKNTKDIYMPSLKYSIRDV